MKARYKWPVMDAEYHTHYVLRRLKEGLGVPYRATNGKDFRGVSKLRGGYKLVRRS